MITFIGCSKNETSKKPIKKKKEKIIEKNPELLNLKDSAIKLFKQKSWEKAQKTYIKILKIDPNNMNAKQKIALISEKLEIKKNYVKAVSLFFNKEHIKSIKIFEKLPKDSKYYKEYLKTRDKKYLKICDEIEKSINNDKFDTEKIEKYFHLANSIKITKRTKELRKQFLGKKQELEDLEELEDLKE